MIDSSLIDYYEARTGELAAVAARRLAASRTPRQTLAALAAFDLALEEFRAAQPDADWMPALGVARGGAPVFA